MQATTNIRLVFIDGSNRDVTVWQTEPLLPQLRSLLGSEQKFDAYYNQIIIEPNNTAQQLQIQNGQTIGILYRTQEQEQVVNVRLLFSDGKTQHVTVWKNQPLLHQLSLSLGSEQKFDAVYNGTRIKTNDTAHLLQISNGNSIDIIYRISKQEADPALIAHMRQEGFNV